MKTITVQIGNSDDKLTQVEWSSFVGMTAQAISRFTAQTRIHFMGGAASWQPWQNAAWIFEINDRDVEALKATLVEVRKAYHQDSIAYLEGETQLI